MIKYHRRKDCSRLITGLGTGFAPFRVMKELFCLSWVQFLLCVCPEGALGLPRFSEGGGTTCDRIERLPRSETLPARPWERRSGLPPSLARPVAHQDGGATARRQPQSLAAAGRHHGAAPPRCRYDTTTNTTTRAKTRLARASDKTHAVGLGHRR